MRTDWLHDVANEMEIDDGVIWVYGVEEDGISAFTAVMSKPEVEAPRRIECSQDRSAPCVVAKREKRHSYLKAMLRARRLRRSTAPKASLQQLFIRRTEQSRRLKYSVGRQIRLSAAVRSYRGPCRLIRQSRAID
jgi:hypothetical protein